MERLADPGPVARLGFRLALALAAQLPWAIPAHPAAIHADSADPTPANATPANAALGYTPLAPAAAIHADPANAAPANAAPPIHTAPVTVGPLMIAIPNGFEAAQRQKLKKSLTAAWTRSTHNGSQKTLLQVNVIDFGSPPGKPAAAQELSVYAEEYLHQFLSGIERRRASFVSSPVAHISLAGLPAARATWNGNIGGRAVVGVMYCVVVHNRYAVIFQTQDLGSAPSSGMFEAMRSIEAATLVQAAAPAGIS